MFVQQIYCFSIDCSPQCASCSASADNCLSCSEGRVSLPSCNCDSKYYVLALSTAEECTPIVCSNKCATCLSVPGNCVTCASVFDNPPDC